MGMSTEKIISVFFKNEQCNILPCKKKFENKGPYLGPESPKLNIFDIIW